MTSQAVMRPTVTVLLIDDDEQAFVMTRMLLEQATSRHFALEWIPYYEQGLAALLSGNYDVALVDYRLDTRNGVDLLRQARAQSCTKPLIMLTGDGDAATDLEAMNAGADDFLVKGEITAALLDRAIRYAVERWRDRNESDRHRAHLAAIVEGSSSAILSTTLDGIIESWNAGAERLFGYRADEVIGRSVTMLIPRHERAGVPKILAQVAAGEWVQDREATRITKLGRRVNVTVTISPIRDASGIVTGVSALVRDVTARKLAEAELQRTTAHLRAVLSALPVAVWAVDRSEKVTLSEGRLLEKLGLQPGQAVGRSIRDFEHPSGVETRRDAFLGRFRTWSTEVNGLSLESSYSPTYAANGSIDTIIGVTIDVTDRIKIEEQLRQSQKMEAMGRLAGGVAHDFNNLLTAILGFGEVMIEKLAPGEPARDDLAQILTAGHSAAALTKQLLAFSRQQTLSVQTLNVNDIAQGVEGLLHRVIGEDVELTLTLDPALRPVRVDRGQLEQILMNLAVNARDAMPDGGRLTVETRNVDLDAAYAEKHPDSHAGPHVMIAISDTGTGMSKAVLERIFEPFFTTKPPGCGTGLGLSTVYGIVKQSGGSIWVYSEAGHGTTFKVYFPVAADAPGAAATESAPDNVWGSETVLIVEDQLPVRMIAGTVLSRHGYSVVEAASCEEALDWVSAHPGRVDLLLTDVVMPQMSGRTLAQKLAEAGESVRVLYMSGYTDDVIVRHGVLDAGVAFLQKPFTPNGLLGKVRGVLDSALPHVYRPAHSR